MHEYSLVSSLMRSVEAQVRAHGAKAVSKVWMQIGDMSGVERDLFATAYETFKPGTVCENAPLEIEPVPVVWGCRKCDLHITPGTPLRCPTCGDPAQLVQGDEIVLARLELEVDDV